MYKRDVVSAEAVSRRMFLAGAGCVAAVSLLDGCGASESIATDAVAQTVRPNTLNHFIVTGQSLSCGTAGSPALSTVQPFHNKMFAFPDTPTYDRVPLSYNAVTKGYAHLELRTLVNGPSVDKIGTPVETIANGFADSMTARFRASHPPQEDFEQLLSCSGEGGMDYMRLGGPSDVAPDGTPSFQEMMSQVALGRSLATAAGLEYNVPAMLLIHGEADIANNQYAANLKTWQGDMQAGVNAITGGRQVIPMIASQTQYRPASVHNNGGMPFENDAGQLGTLAAAMANPGRICLACPEYVMEHGSVHMTADGYRHLGLMMAKAAYQIVVEGEWWWPLMPLKTKQTGDLITVTYRVPRGPLVIDTSWVTNPGNYGFNYVDSEGTKITRVEVTGPEEIGISLSKATTGGMLSYALAPAPAGPVSPGFGPQSGPRGCVRDSDPMVSYYNHSKTGKPYTMHNYSVGWQTVL